MKINTFKAFPILALLAIPLAAQTPSPYNTPAPDDPNRMNPISAPKNAAPPADASTTSPRDTQMNDTMTTTATTTTPSTDTNATDESLPQTASPLALLALLAASSAGSAFGIRKARRQ